MIRVGLIGGIGSGKSFVAKLFHSPVFNADNEVKVLYKKNIACFKKLKKKLPKFIKSFPINKDELINAIKSNKKNLNKISKVVHPFVRKKLSDFLHRNRKCKIVVLDIPLLIENKLNKKKDVLIFIKSDKTKILKRLKQRPNYNKKILQNFKENQIILTKKLKLADYIVDNNFSPNIMKNKIKLLKKKILNEINYS